MSRPATGRNGKPKKLYLNEKITKAADRLAFKKGESLSDMVERLLKKAVSAEERRIARELHA